MDTFDQRRTASLVFGLVALGLAFAVGHVNEHRGAVATDTPAETRLAATGRG